ncbi:MAG: V/A-type H+/Na+-transporting ATPase subunit [Thermoplasmata archaeon]|nr:V/A-type H+/Na+-transporting ATPase subunit [Thermoplasmata archaeon]
MSFLPARMRRLLVGGHKAHLEGVIDTLHAEGVLHVEDYLDPTHTTDIGTPLEAGEQASALLVQVRGLQKALGCDGAAPLAEPVAPEQAFHAAEAAGKGILESAARLATQVQALESEAAVLRPLAPLDFELSALPGLRSVKAYAGTCRTDPTAAVQAAGFPHELQVAPGPSGLAVLLIVGAAHAAAAEKALAESGFAAAQLPLASGTPAQRLAAIAAERANAETALAAVAQERAQLAAHWGPRLATAERLLVAQVEKTQAPLKFAVTPTTFHVEGWVPQSQLARVQAALEQGFGQSLYVADLGDAPREHAGADHHRGHGDGHATHTVAATSTAAGGSGGYDEAAEHGGHPAADAKDEPPIHLENKGLARPYEFMLGLLGKPRYQEIDPTKLMLVFFPLFFGLMVGDFLVGLVIVGVGLFLKKNKVFGIGGPAVGRALVMGGVMATLVGLVVFGEALAIHFVAPEPGEMSWESLLGLHFPYADQAHGLLFKTGHAPVEAAASGLATHAEEAAHGSPGILGMLAPHAEHHLSVGGMFNLGYYSKIHDIQALLLWSVIIGLLHLVLGFSLGVRNVYVAHGAKLAIQEKLAWLTLIVGAFLAIGGLMAGSKLVLAAGGAVAVGSIALLWAGAQHVLGAGFIAVLEVFGLVGNLLSYTRLAAIGASKAGMALAFSALGFQLAGGGVLGWGIYLLGFVLITVLAILSGGLQALRLQFVEFFGKFYTGGGRPYLPFGRRAA